MPPTPPRPSRADEEMRLGWRLAALGMELVAEVVAGILIGMAIDWYFETKRWTAIGAIVGIVVGMVHFVQAAWRVQKKL